MKPDEPKDRGINALTQPAGTKGWCSSDLVVVLKAGVGSLMRFRSVIILEYPARALYDPASSTLAERGEALITRLVMALEQLMPVDCTIVSQSMDARRDELRAKGVTEMFAKRGILATPLRFDELGHVLEPKANMLTILLTKVE